MGVEWGHTTQVKGQSTGRRQGPAEGLALQATKAWEKRDEVFIVLFDYSVGMIEKGETGLCALRVVVATQS